MTYWKDTLLVGVSAIDEQHKRLIAAIDELMDACSKGQGRAAIEKTLTFVMSYTAEHFADEERLQARYGYPDIAAHKRQHEQFVHSVTVLMDELKRDGPSVALTGKLNSTLVNWLIRHISTEDKRIGEHIKQTTSK